MPGVVLLVAAVVVNLHRHRRHQTTICQTVRTHVPPRVAAAGLLAGFSWLFPHLLRGYPPVVQGRMDQAIRPQPRWWNTSTGA